MIGMDWTKAEEAREYVDVEDALKRIRGNTKIFKTLLKSFLANDYMAPILNDLEAGDLDAAAKSVHTLKGVSANLSFMKLNALMLSMEKDLKAGTRCDDKAQELKLIMDKTKDYVNRLIECI